MDTDGFIIYIVADDIYKEIYRRCERRVGASNYELDNHFRKKKTKRFIGLVKLELGG